MDKRNNEYMLKEYTSNLSVSDGSDFFANEEEAWNNLKRLLPKNAFGVLYVLHRAELPAINSEKCIEAFNKKYLTEKETLYISYWKPLFIGRQCDEYTMPK